MSDTGEGAEQANAPYFFLSYARTPKFDPSDTHDPDAWVAKLYRDLIGEIARLTGSPPEAAGFMDRQMTPGTEWSQELEWALSTCRVFVPLYSPRYFDNELCGKEWYAFARRTLDQKARGGEPADAIVPVFWVSVDSSRLPEVAQAVQLYDLGSSRYSVEGFYGIIKIGRYRDDYQIAVHHLARRIVDIAIRIRVDPATPQDLASLASAFAPDSASHEPGRRLHIIVVAPNSSNHPTGRSTLYYGPAARDWQPFRPQFSQSLAEYTADLATALGYQPAISTIDEQAGEATDAAALTGPGLLLVDPWATSVPELRDWLREFDDISSPWTELMIPWNYRDPENITHEPDLRQGLRSSLRHMLERVSPAVRIAADGIPSLETFGNILPTIASNGLKKYLQQAPVSPADSPLSENPHFRMDTPDVERHDE